MTMATKNFSWSELQCRCGCGTRHVSAVALQRLQLLRTRLGRPLTINSACRCPVHNARVGGKPLSKHRSTQRRPSTAFDISTKDWPDIWRRQLIQEAAAVGFNGIGKYATFIHVDVRPQIGRW